MFHSSVPAFRLPWPWARYPHAEVYLGESKVSSFTDKSSCEKSWWWGHASPFPWEPFLIWGSCWPSPQSSCAAALLVPSCISANLFFIQTCWPSILAWPWTCLVPVALLGDHWTVSDCDHCLTNQSWRWLATLRLDSLLVKWRFSHALVLCLAPGYCFCCRAANSCCFLKPPTAKHRTLLISS